MQGFVFNAAKLEAKNNQYFMITQYFPIYYSASYINAPDLLLYFGTPINAYIH